MISQRNLIISYPMPWKDDQQLRFPITVDHHTQQVQLTMETLQELIGTCQDLKVKVRLE